MHRSRCFFGGAPLFCVFLPRDKKSFSRCIWITKTEMLLLAICEAFFHSFRLRTGEMKKKRYRTSVTGMKTPFFCRLCHSVELEFVEDLKYSIQYTIVLCIMQRHVNPQNCKKMYYRDSFLGVT